MLQILHIMLTKGSSRTGLAILSAQHLISYSSEDKPLPPGAKGGLLIFSFTFSIYSENFPSSLIPPACIIIQVIKNCRSLTQFCIFITFGRKSAAIILFQLISTSVLQYISWIKPMQTNQQGDISHNSLSFWSNLSFNSSLLSVSRFLGQERVFHTTAEYARMDGFTSRATAPKCRTKRLLGINSIKN